MIRRMSLLGTRTLNSLSNEFFSVKLRCLFSTRTANVSNVPDLNPSLVKNTRYKQGQTILKNSLLVKNAAAAGINISDIIYRKKSLLEEIPSNVLKNIKLHQTYKLPVELEMNFTEEFNDMIGICDIPTSVHDSPEELDTNKISQGLPVNIILDNIRNYENMGMVIHLFQKLRCKKLLLTAGCVDIWNPKTIECAMGSHFMCHTLIKANQSWTDMKDHLLKDSVVLMADAFRTDSVESTQNSPVKYTDFDYRAHPEITLIIGGETEGLSNMAKEFHREKMGCKIYIPLQAEVDSLNGGIATAVILSEISRQIHRTEL